MAAENLQTRHLRESDLVTNEIEDLEEFLRDTKSSVKTMTLALLGDPGLVEEDVTALYFQMRQIEDRFLMLCRALGY